MERVEGRVCVWRDRERHNVCVCAAHARKGRREIQRQNRNGHGDDTRKEALTETGTDGETGGGERTSERETKGGSRSHKEAETMAETGRVGRGRWRERACVLLDRCEEGYRSQLTNAGPVSVLIMEKASNQPCAAQQERGRAMPEYRE